ncbi:MAG: MFS transporter [Thermomicrobiales bacterium]
MRRKLLLADQDTPTAAVQLPATKGTFYAIAAYQQFRFLWTAGVVTQLGQWFQTIALAWLALTLTDSAAFVGQIGFASGLPILCLSLPAGALLDRFDRRRALLICQVLGALLAVTIAVIIARGAIAPWHLIVAAVFSGSLLAVAQPATQTLVPALVDHADLPNALALSSAGSSSTRIVGPSIAGVLIGAVGIAGCFFSQGGALLAAACLTLLLRVPRGARSGITLGSGLLDGLAFIRRDRNLVGMLLLAGAPALLAYPYIQMLPVIARDVLPRGPRGLGVLMAASGVGGLLGALTTASMGAYPHKGRLTVIVGLVYGVVLAAFALTPLVIVAGAILMVSTFLGTMFYSLNQIMVQTYVREAMRGRVLGALALTVGLQPVGSLFVGELAQRIGAPDALAACTLASSLLVGLIALRYRAVAKL